MIAENNLKIINTRGVDNEYGLIQASDELIIYTEGFIKNSGILFGFNKIQFNDKTGFTNTKHIETKGKIFINSGTKFNNTGSIISLNQINIIDNNDINNKDGKIFSGGNIYVNSKLGKFYNTGGLVSGEEFKLNSYGAITNDGKIDVIKKSFIKSLTDSIVNTGKIQMMTTSQRTVALTERVVLSGSSHRSVSRALLDGEGEDKRRKRNKRG